MRRDKTPKRQLTKAEIESEVRLVKDRRKKKFIITFVIGFFIFPVWIASAYYLFFYGDEAKVMQKAINQICKRDRVAARVKDILQGEVGE